MRHSTRGSANELCTYLHGSTAFSMLTVRAWFVTVELEKVQGVRAPHGQQQRHGSGDCRSELQQDIRVGKRWPALERGNIYPCSELHTGGNAKEADICEICSTGSTGSECLAPSADASRPLTDVRRQEMFTNPGTHMRRRPEAACTAPAYYQRYGDGKPHHCTNKGATATLQATGDSELAY